MDTVELDLGSASYPIHIGTGLLQDGTLLREYIAGQQVMVVSNETIAPLYLKTLLATLEGLDVATVMLPDGEQYKNLDTLNLVFTALLEHNHNRGTTIIALGGGVVGDMAGFAAATYQRGVAFIQIPTTLLSQVDSSVGGKTAVNHALGKNMIGAFYQPRAVIIDTGTLATLPKREMAAGLAEVIKHGAIADAEYFEWLEADLGLLLALDEEAVRHAVKRSCEIKAAVVAQDEREIGVRALLNFGHTFGHAIENGLGYGQWLHGEAVGAGMVMAADLSARMGLCSATEGRRLKALIARAGLPVLPPGSIGNEFLALMQRDKKMSDAGLKFVLLKELGKATLVTGVDPLRLQATLEAGEALLA